MHLVSSSFIQVVHVPSLATFPENSFVFRSAFSAAAPSPSCISTAGYTTAGLPSRSRQSSCVAVGTQQHVSIVIVHLFMNEEKILKVELNRCRSLYAVRGIVIDGEKF